MIINKTRADLLAEAKPILFNTEMVQAILDGQKTVTRRIINPKYRDGEAGFNVWYNEITKRYVVEKYDEDEMNFCPTRYVSPRYEVGDILYVRETWAEVEACDGRPFNIFKSDDNGVYADDNHKFTGWRPSIHMPKESARIFLCVTGVRAEKLQDIDVAEAHKEGVTAYYPKDYIHYFENLWTSTIKKSELDKYGWNANPWVWVYEFERIEYDEMWNCRKNGKAFAVISQSAIYKDGKIVGIQKHQPIIKELRGIENNEP